MKAWAESLEGITYPLLSDFYPHGKVAQTYGVFRADGTSERAIYVINRAGTIHYVNVHDIDSQPDNEVLFQALGQIAPGGSYRPVEAPALNLPGPEAEVMLYCTPWCPDCRRARAYFRDRNIPFQEVDITRSLPAAKKVREWNSGNEKTPTITIRGQVIRGFDPARLDALLSGHLQF